MVLVAHTLFHHCPYKTESEKPPDCLNVNVSNVPWGHCLLNVDSIHFSTTSILTYWGKKHNAVTLKKGFSYSKKQIKKVNFSKRTTKPT